MLLRPYKNQPRSAPSSSHTSAFFSALLIFPRPLDTRRSFPWVITPTGASAHQALALPSANTLPDPDCWSPPQGSFPSLSPLTQIGPYVPCIKSRCIIRAQIYVFTDCWILPELKGPESYWNLIWIRSNGWLFTLTFVLPQRRRGKWKQNPTTTQLSRKALVSRYRVAQNYQFLLLLRCGSSANSITCGIQPANISLQDKIKCQNCWFPWRDTFPTTMNIGQTFLHKICITTYISVMQRYVFLT